MIRGEPHYRRWAFEQGLRAEGFEIHGQCRTTPRSDDILVIWNRYGRFNADAEAFEHAGARVIVAENGLFGRDWRGQHWYSLALGVPAAGGGVFEDHGPARWDSWGVEICEWRNTGKEVIVLAQRGIGPVGIAQPGWWHQRAAEQLRKTTNRNVRIREHPGEKPSTPLEEDLRDAHAVVTWASGAALKALLLGVPVFHGFSGWCGAEASAPFGTNIEQPSRPDRLPILRRLAWSTWTTDEIATGQPFANLLGSGSTGSRSTTAAH